MKVIKAIIFDCFGVLVEESLGSFYDKHFGDDEVLKAEAREADHLSTQGKITWDEFLDVLSRMSGVAAEQINNELERNPANRDLLEYIRMTLKPQYKIGFLSNAADDWMEDLFSAEDIALFDDIILSYQHGINKPSQEIFELAANRLGVEPSECIFVDDIERYCTGARQTGMTAIQFTDTESCLKDIQEALAR